uniref:Uncharacterized protein n=1 Tax=Timema bartmani TaxID=61472 RepID=A0A7R9I063_9NEOP|nr:unnamed protein product [Timema bartmani]
MSELKERFGRRHQTGSITGKISASVDKIGVAALKYTNNVILVLGTVAGFYCRYPLQLHKRY